MGPGVHTQATLRGGKGSLRFSGDKVGESIGAWRIRKRADPAMLGKSKLPQTAKSAALALAASTDDEMEACTASRARAHTSIMRSPTGGAPFYWVYDKVR